MTTTRNRGVALAALIALSFPLAGCIDACGKQAETEEEADDDDRPSSRTTPPAPALGDDIYYGDERAYELDATDAQLKSLYGAAPHSPIEPSYFDAGWVGREAWDVLQRAKKKEFVHRVVRTSSGMPCLVFHDRNMARRMLIGTLEANSWLEEMTFSQRGDLILWYQTDHQKPPQQFWAFFHRGINVMLYQEQRPGTARQTVATPPGLAERILSQANDCLARFGAANPRPAPGALPPPPPPPAPAPVTPPAAGGSEGHFGALAWGPADKRWGVASRRANDADAQAAAIQFCGRADCQVKMTFGRGQCMSVSHGPPGYVAWGRADSVAASKQVVLEQCKKDGHSCTPQGSWCNDPPQDTPTPPPVQPPAEPPPVVVVPPPRPAPTPRPAQACSDYYCTLPQGTIGMCKSGVCQDPCPAGTGFHPTDAECHPRCVAGGCSGALRCSAQVCVPF